MKTTMKPQRTEAIRPAVMTAVTSILSLLLNASVAFGGDGDGGRVLWTVRLDDYTPIQFVAVAPASSPHAGTIYATAGEAIYAISPAGNVLWISPAAPSDGVAHSISLGADGTIYTGMGLVGDAYALVVALNPDGSVRWQYVPPVFGSLVTGPNVGPDGNIYAVQAPVPFNGLGAFSLDPDGNLRWSNVGDLPQDFPANTFWSTSDIEFGADRLHTGYVKIGFANPTIHTFSLAGDFLWSDAGLFPGTHSLPVVDPADRVLCTWGQTGLQAFSPDGAQEWFALHPNGASLVQRPAVDAQGNIYTGDFVGLELWALTPGGATRWVLPPEEAYLSHVAVSPDGRTLVITGQVFNGLHWVRGYAAEDGALLWQVDLPPENNLAQFANTYEPAFAPDSSAVYVTTQFVGSANDYGYLYAIALTDDGPPPPTAVTGDAVGSGNRQRR